MASHAPSRERVAEMAENIREVREEMATVTGPSGSGKPVLVLVSKLKPPSDVMAAYEALDEADRHFGENYVQELVDKAKELPRDIKWHFIGSLQSNKCKVLAGIPNLYVVETLDSIKKADLFEKALAGDADPDRKLNVYLQVNTSGEDAKSGLSPSSKGGEDGSVGSLMAVARHVVQNCPHLNLLGLMTIGALQSSHQARDGQENPDFTALKDARDALQRDFGLKNLQLSMGMSEDFLAAIKAGSNNIRIGTRLFGKRPSKEEAKNQRGREIAP